MKCPNCQRDLEQIDFRGIMVNECPDCQGRWFGRDDLEKAKNNTDDDLRWIDFDPFIKKAKHFNVIPDEAGACPQCDQTMIALAYAHSGVVIMKCEQCRGIWLQDGEFKKIIGYLENMITSHSASEYAQDSIKQFLEIFKGSQDKTAEAKDFLVVLKLLKLRAAVEHSKIAEATNKIYQYLPFL